MYLVLRQDPSAAGGWSPVVLSAAATAKDAASEAFTGKPGDLAVIEWTPEYFSAEMKLETKALTAKQFEDRQIAKAVE